MDLLLTGKIGGGQSAAIKRRQKFGAPGGIGPGGATARRNSVLLHARIFSTIRWSRIGGRRLLTHNLWMLARLKREKQEPVRQAA